MNKNLLTKELDKPISLEQAFRQVQNSLAGRPLSLEELSEKFAKMNPSWPNPFMTPNIYQNDAFDMALPECQNSTYMVLGLCNEAGEVAGKLKKYLRKDITTEALKEAITDELGDTLWYLSGAAVTFGVDLETVMQRNLDKLRDRRERGVLRGNGDNR